MKWNGSEPSTCEIRGEKITDEFIDGKTKMGPWAIMCPRCWGVLGVGRLGTGFGQRYLKHDGDFIKVEG